MFPRWCISLLLLCIIKDVPAEDVSLTSSLKNIVQDLKKTVRIVLEDVTMKIEKAVIEIGAKVKKLVTAAEGQIKSAVNDVVHQVKSLDEDMCAYTKHQVESAVIIAAAGMDRVKTCAAAANNAALLISATLMKHISQELKEFEKVISLLKMCEGKSLVAQRMCVIKKQIALSIRVVEMTTRSSSKSALAATQIAGLHAKITCCVKSASAKTASAIGRVGLNGVKFSN